MTVLIFTFPQIILFLSHGVDGIGRQKDEIVLYVDSTPVLASIDGILRGLVNEIHVKADEKMGDVEPRNEASYCSAISDKAGAIAGGVLEAVPHYTA